MIEHTSYMVDMTPSKHDAIDHIKYAMEKVNEATYHLALSQWNEPDDEVVRLARELRESQQALAKLWTKRVEES